MRMCDWCVKPMGLSRVVLYVGKGTKLVFHGEKDLDCYRQYRSFREQLIGGKTKNQPAPATSKIINHAL